MTVAQTRISNKLAHQTFTLPMCNSPRQIFIFVANRVYRIWSNGPCFNHAFNSIRTYVVHLFDKRHVKSLSWLLSKITHARSQSRIDRRSLSLLEERNLRFRKFGKKRRKRERDYKSFISLDARYDREKRHSSLSNLGCRDQGQSSRTATEIRDGLADLRLIRSGVSRLNNSAGMMADIECTWE